MNARPIVLLAPNPTVDILFSAPRRRRFDKTFFESTSIRAGGSGINVARGLHDLGVAPALHVILGGTVGRLARRELEREGLPASVSEAPGPTRLTTIEYRETGKRMLVSPSPRLDAGAMRLFLESCAADVDRAALILVGGSLRAEPECYGLLADALRPHRDRLCLDTRGDLLRRLLPLEPLFAKIDDPDLFGAAESMAAAGAVGELALASHRRGVGIVCSECYDRLIVAHGGQLFEYRQSEAPPTRQFGRGDALVAGFLFGRISGRDVDGCLRTALAASASPRAACEGLGTVNRRRFESEYARLLTTAARRLQ